MLTEDPQRDLRILEHAADEKLRSFVDDVRTTVARITLQRQELQQSGNLTPQGVEHTLKEVRDTERDRLEAAAEFLVQRSENLAAQAKHTNAEPTTASIDPAQRDTLLQSFRSAPDAQKRELIIKLEQNQNLCAAIASVAESDLWAYNISPLTYERATAVSQGGKREESGQFRFPNQAERQNAEAARATHIRALRVLKSI